MNAPLPPGWTMRSSIRWATRGHLSPPVPAAGRKLLTDWKRDVRGSGFVCGLQVSSAVIRSRPRRKSCSISAGKSGSSGGSLLQAEDEIAGIGRDWRLLRRLKAMTATSGPGLSLKTEMLGLASVAELPLVCVNVQRRRALHGMPTKPEQG